MARDTTGGDTPRRSAARVKLFASTTARILMQAGFFADHRVALNGKLVGSAHFLIR